MPLQNSLYSQDESPTLKSSWIILNSLSSFRAHVIHSLLLIIFFLLLQTFFSPRYFFYLLKKLKLSPPLGSSSSLPRLGSTHVSTLPDFCYFSRCTVTQRAVQKGALSDQRSSLYFFNLQEYYVWHIEYIIAFIGKSYVWISFQIKMFINLD